MFSVGSTPETLMWTCPAASSGAQGPNPPVDELPLQQPPASLSVIVPAAVAVGPALSHGADQPATVAAEGALGEAPMDLIEQHGEVDPMECDHEVRCSPPPLHSYAGGPRAALLASDHEILITDAHRRLPSFAGSEPSPEEEGMDLDSQLPQHIQPAEPAAPAEPHSRMQRTGGLDCALPSVPEDGLAADGTATVAPAGNVLPATNCPSAVSKQSQKDLFAYFSRKKRPSAASAAAADLPARTPILSGGQGPSTRGGAPLDGIKRNAETFKVQGLGVHFGGLDDEDLSSVRIPSTRGNKGHGDALSPSPSFSTSPPRRKPSPPTESLPPPLPPLEMPPPPPPPMRSPFQLPQEFSSSRPSSSPSRATSSSRR